jgi:DUF1680 family protein
LGACALHSPSLAKPGGPAVPTSSALGAQRPLTAAGARLIAGLLHDWQRRNASASMPLALRQLVVAGNLDNVRLAIAAAAPAAAATATEDPATAGASHVAAASHGAASHGAASHGAASHGAAAPAAMADGTHSAVIAVPVDVTTADGTPADGDGRRPRQLGPVDPVPGLGYRGPVFMDSDIYKTLEAIGWELAHGPEAALTDFAASTIDLLREAQQPDGYLNSYVQASGEPRYARLAWSHEMYCAGHLIQAAIAMYRGTGETGLLDIAIRLADHLVREFTNKDSASKNSASKNSASKNSAANDGAANDGAPPNRALSDRATSDTAANGASADSTANGDASIENIAVNNAARNSGLDGHPIIETALAELYRETGTESYLTLAQQFVNQRGYGLIGDSGMGRRYLQDHVPVRESPTEVGHAVRALYLEAGVTDVATETHDHELLESSIRRWDDMVATKTALTGGNGSRHVDEGFGDRFELPPDRAYNETCAAIASFQWSWRLLLATGEAKYADHMERVLYNGFAAAVASSGDRFFYVNPLQRREDHFEKDDPGRRRVWFNCACCPPNIMRLLASLQHYLATTADDTLYVHQFATAELTGADLDVELTTDYPWSGLITVRIKAAPPSPRGLALRIPAWSANTSYKINNFAERSVAQPAGYLLLHQEWRPGDEITLHLDMTPRWTYPDRRVDAVRGCAAIERGPLVYCFEQADQLVRLDELAARPGTRLAEREATLDGIGQTVQVSVVARHLPPTPEAAVPRVSAVAIPYFQWDNRGPGGMRVWIPSA